MRLIIFVLMMILICARVQAKAQEFCNSSSAAIIYENGNAIYQFNVDTQENNQLSTLRLGDEDRLAWDNLSNEDFVLIERRDSNGIAGIDIYNLASQEHLNVSLPVNASSIAISPNGEQIAFTRLIELDDFSYESELWIYEVATQYTRPIYRAVSLSTNDLFGVSIVQLEWSPDGQKLLINEQHVLALSAPLQGKQVLVLLDVSTYRSRILFDTWYGNHDFEWSPTSQWILVSVRYEVFTNEIVSDLYILNANDKSSFKVTFTPEVGEFDLRWTTDGKFILYQEQPNHRVTIALEEVLTGSFARRYVFSRNAISALQDFDYWSFSLNLDAEKVAYFLNTTQDGRQVYELYVSNIDGTKAFYVDSFTYPASIYWRTVSTCAN